MYQIQPCDDPYSQLIANAVAREFPTQCVANNLVLVDRITNEILGTKQQRYGPKPSPESLVQIRDVIRHWTALELPIPFVVPWGSEKPDGGGIDLAEMWAMKMLRCLDHRIRSHYREGAVFHIRVEDVSAPHLFYDRADQAREDARYYSNAFEALLAILEMGPVIQSVRESRFCTEERFNSEADSLLSIMEGYVEIPGSDWSAAQLADRGWKGNLSEETKMFYLRQFEKLYPYDNEQKRVHRLARYFAGSLARKRLGLTGVSPAWNGIYLDLSFMASAPGTEASFGRRVYYRTLPCSVTSNHMPPWRSKGYILIDGDDEAKPKLASFNEPQEYNKNTVTLVNEALVHGLKSVTVQADYIVA